MKRTVFVAIAVLALAVPAAVGARITASHARATPDAAKPAAATAVITRDGRCAAHAALDSSL
jgi:hypothetical protein